jgi:hypothetical protein
MGGLTQQVPKKSLREEDLRVLLPVAYNLCSERITHHINNRNKGVSDNGFVWGYVLLLLVPRTVGICLPQLLSSICFMM